MLGLQRIRHPRLPPPSSSLRHRPPPVPGSLRRMGALVRRLRGHVLNGCPSAPPAFPGAPFPSSSYSPVARSPASALRIRGTPYPAFPAGTPPPLSPPLPSCRLSARASRIPCCAHRLSRCALLLRHAPPRPAVRMISDSSVPPPSFAPLPPSFPPAQSPRNFLFRYVCKCRIFY